MRFLFSYAATDLRASVRRLWLFILCLILGVALVMSAASVYQMLARSLLADTRVLMGGDVEIEYSAPLTAPVLDWLNQHGEVSLTREVNTMLAAGKANDNSEGSGAGGQEDGGASGTFMLVEVLSVDKAYPLYGEVSLNTGEALHAALAEREGQWGIAVDSLLAERLGVAVGETLTIGRLDLPVRALVTYQPDRRLNANWRGAPVLIADAALDASGLLHPASRIEYEYRVRVAGDAEAWASTFIANFPDSPWEVQTFRDRSERLAERLDKISSGLLIVAFTTLFIGGLGVYHSVALYLQHKQRAMATLKALGVRDRRAAIIYLVQIMLVAAVAGAIGVALGAGLASVAAQLLGEQLPMQLAAIDLLQAAVIAWIFGMLTAITFALPALGRAANIDVASLFRQQRLGAGQTGGGAGGGLRDGWLAATVLSVLLLGGFILWAIPNLLFGLGFLGALAVCLVFFEGVARILKNAADRVGHWPALLRHTALRLALANCHRPDTPLRTTLLSLGSALTLLVASAVVVAALLRLVYSTLPEDAPALILYDVFADQQQTVVDIVAAQSDGTPASPTGSTVGENGLAEPPKALQFAPLVRGRVHAINGAVLAQRNDGDIDWQEMARDEHKLSYLADNIDGLQVVAGQLWTDPGFDQTLPEGSSFFLAMEDREADEMGVQPGDRLTFNLVGQQKTGVLTAIYRQRGLQTRFWFEAIFSAGALDAHIHRYVATLHTSPAHARAVQTALAREVPNVVTVLTEDLIASASDLLAKASQGLALLAGTSLLVSLMVLGSVMAAGRERQVYDATIMHVVGARLAYIRHALHIEYALLGTLVALFSSVLGLTIAAMILRLQLKLDAVDVYLIGALTAVVSVVLVFSIGAMVMFRRMRLQPARLLRDAL